jgi:hypothetical protein
VREGREKRPTPLFRIRSIANLPLRQSHTPERVAQRDGLRQICLVSAL